MPSVVEDVCARSAGVQDRVADVTVALPSIAARCRCRRRGAAELPLRVLLLMVSVSAAEGH